MAYIGIPVFPQQELTSVRRIRESGVKGMKWGRRKSRSNRVTFRGQQFNPYDSDHPLHDAYWQSKQSPEWKKSPPKSERPKGI
jgi:hypothetical protein